MSSLKSSQKIILAAIFIFGIVVSIILVRNQQDLRQRASETGISVKPMCSVDKTVDIQIDYTNTSTEIIDVAAKDDLSGNEVSLGTVNPGDSIFGIIHTGLGSIKQGNVIIKTSTNETVTVPYPVLTCLTDNRPACVDNQAQCTWDLLDNTTQYKVTIIDIDSNETIKTGIVNHPTNSYIFPTQPGKNYSCEVIPLNSCGQGIKAKAIGSCPNITPTAETTIAPSVTPSVQPTATLTPEPTATPTPQPTVTSTSSSQITTTPTNGVGASINYYLSATPTPFTVLPPTGLSYNLITITIVGCVIALMGSFVIIFLW
jgi:hypothetical protein